jgi:hypothetical protein
LISRIQWSYDLSNPQELALALFTEFTDHIAVRKILTEIKGRVEGEIEPMAQQNAELSLFFISFVVFLVSLILILLNPFRWSGWLASLGAGIAWLITWYGPVNLWGGILLTSFVVIGLVAGYRK